jgi:Sec-independent protein translocase protein TatA
MGGDLLVVLLVILAIVLVWRGPKNLPKLGAALGRTVRDARREIEAKDDEPGAPPPSEPADRP